jgi:hypothetical protein
VYEDVSGNKNENATLAHAMRSQELGGRVVGHMMGKLASGLERQRTYSCSDRNRIRDLDANETSDGNGGFMPL